MSYWDFIDRKLYPRYYHNKRKSNSLLVIISLFLLVYSLLVLSIKDIYHKYQRKIIMHIQFMRATPTKFIKIQKQVIL